ncbi:DUF3096 domain-containing protein [Pseudoxanthobacter sp. M-2]|jgi:hypothetical protein|uniref:DUF3096 domain-containing protein n=1 Tax=Pseudoxanthobacter sp. M-2 TaxID=3078754 RepID=UPI0038FC1AB4
MTIDVVTLQPLLAIVIGVLILIVPRILNYAVAAYLIIIGVLGLWPNILNGLN